MSTSDNAYQPTPIDIDVLEQALLEFAGEPGTVEILSNMPAASIPTRCVQHGISARFGPDEVECLVRRRRSCARQRR